MTSRRSLMRLIGLGLSLLASDAWGACLSHSEARRAYGFGLRWVSDGQGHRCWTKSSVSKTGRSFSSPVISVREELEQTHRERQQEGLGMPSQDMGKPKMWMWVEGPSNEVLPLYEIPLLAEKSEPMKLTIPFPPEAYAVQPEDVRKSAQNSASSIFPVMLTGFSIIGLFVLGWRWSYSLDTAAGGRGAARLSPARRRRGSHSLGRLAKDYLAGVGRRHTTRPQFWRAWI
jgi:hypothetical protein